MTKIKKKIKKAGSILALSAVAPSAIIAANGSTVSAVKESNNSTSWSLWGLFNIGKISYGLFGLRCLVHLHLYF